MATLMAGHRKMEESKQVRDDPSTSQALKNASGESSGHCSGAPGCNRPGECCQVRDMDLGLVLADVLHEGSVNPQHE